MKEICVVRETSYLKVELVINEPEFPEEVWFVLNNTKNQKRKKEEGSSQTF